jgi:hypothetical protein
MKNDVPHEKIFSQVFDFKSYNLFYERNRRRLVLHSTRIVYVLILKLTKVLPQNSITKTFNRA